MRLSFRLYHFRVSTVFFFFHSGVSKLFGAKDLYRQAAYSVCESSFLIHHGGYHDLFFFVHDDSLTS